MTAPYISCNIYVMKRTTVFLDDSILVKANRYAEKHGTSFASVVREALAVFLTRPAEESMLPSIAGRFSSGRTDTSERADELLWRDPHA